jgi:hypothetical protein
MAVSKRAAMWHWMAKSGASADMQLIEMASASGAAFNEMAGILSVPRSAKSYAQSGQA